jgi:hypothetical protein
MKPISSVTTTFQSKAASQIGTQPGGRGVATQSNSVEVAQWLAARTPDAVDNAAVLRASQRGVRLTISKGGRATYDDRGNQTGFVTFAEGCDVDGSEADRAAALEDMEKFCTPAPQRAIEGWLAELSVIVARRGDDDFGDELRLSAYAARLGQYPADVVRQALLGESWKWWPTWAELEAVCERLASPRKHMVAALKRGPRQQEPERRPATQEERDRAQALIDEMFPHISAEKRKAAVDEAMSGNCMTGPAPEGEA